MLLLVPCSAARRLVLLAQRNILLHAMPAMLQDEPAYCGLASLAMTLNTLSIDPRRTWKGPWRW